MSVLRRAKRHGELWLGVGLMMVSAGLVASADEPSPAATVPAAAAAASTMPSGATISEADFIVSPFADFFMTGDYPRALDAINALSKQYPNDPLIMRYRAVTLDRLGRYDEAIAIYQQLLERDANHVPTRYFLAQAYYRQGHKDQAIAEWQWVKDNTASKEYRQWSEEFLKQRGVAATRPVERKKFYLFGNTGWEYDSNVILKANDPGLAAGNDKNASRYNFNLGVGYRAIQKPDMRFDVIYTARQSLNDDSLDQFNYTSQELALDAKKRVNIADRDVTLGARYEFLVGFLEDILFSLSNEFLLSADARVTPRTRTYLYNRFAVTNFGPDGSNPPQTSRDGFYYDLGVTQYFYSADYRKYVFVGEEFNLDQTRGANFTERGTTSRVGLHTPVPLVPKTDFDTSAGFRWGAYPRFESLSRLDPTRRADNNWDLYVALTHNITPRLATRVFYRYINANNRNDFFQYDRHIGGVQLLFTQYF